MKGDLKTSSGMGLHGRPQCRSVHNHLILFINEMRFIVFIEVVKGLLRAINLVFIIQSQDIGI
jgi:hypothetical protein